MDSNRDDYIVIRDAMISVWTEFWQDWEGAFTLQEMAASATSLIDRIQSETRHNLGDKDTVRPVIEAVIAVVVARGV